MRSTLLQQARNGEPLHACACLNASHAVAKEKVPCRLAAAATTTCRRSRRLLLPLPNCSPQSTFAAFELLSRQPQHGLSCKLSRTSWSDDCYWTISKVRLSPVSCRGAALSKHHGHEVAVTGCVPIAI